MSVPLRAIAEAAGTSVGSVSRVLNGLQGPSPALRRRVLEAAQALGCSGRDGHGRAGAAPARRVLMLLPRAVDGSLGPGLDRSLLQGVEAACRAADAALSLATLAPADAIGALLAREKPQALLVVGALDAPALAALREPGMPLVLVDHRADGLPAFHDDLCAAAALATGHLLAGGRRRIALAGSRMPAFAAALLQRGHRRALFEAGWLADPDLEALVDEPAPAGAGIAALLGAWRALPQPPDALVAGSAAHALAALRWLRAQGVQVPRDMALVAIGDDAEAERAGLSAVHTDRSALGAAAARTLLGLPAPQAGLPPVTLLARASTRA